MKDSIVAVSSANGLGHTKRLLRILNSFDESLWNKSLVCTQSQRTFIQDDLEFSKDISFIQSESCGLDGPSVNPVISDVSHTLKDLLSNARLVISDNVLWPLTFNERSLLVANFIWLDYWKKRFKLDPLVSKRQTSSLENLIKRDQLIIDNYKVNSIQYLPFGWLDSIKPINFIGLPSKVSIGKSFGRSKEIWVVSGTTGLDILPVPENTHIDYEFRTIETYNFGKKKDLPLAVIGRPGIGSITDTLSYKIPFLPFFSTRDPELIHNTGILKELGLLSLGFSIENFSKYFFPTLIDELAYAETHRPLFAKDFEARFLTPSSSYPEFLCSMLGS